MFTLLLPADVFFKGSRGLWVSDGLEAFLLLPKGGLESAAASAQRRGSAETLSYRLSFGSQINPLLPQVGDLGVAMGHGGFNIHVAQAGTLVICYCAQLTPTYGCSGTWHGVPEHE